MKLWLTSVMAKYALGNDMPYNDSVHHLPSDGLAAFRSFLQSEFSDENIEFWMSCEDFKKIKSPLKMAAKAKKIYEDFIQSEGPREVRNSSDFPLFYYLYST